MLGMRLWVAASSRSGLSIVLAAFVSAACSVGHGTGELDGTLSIAGCRREGPYSLAPDAFFAQTAEHLLSIRVQRGGNLEVYSDGVSVLVRDAALLKREHLGSAIDLATGGAPEVEATAFFNETCPSERTKIPVLLKAMSGTIRFDAIYAPRVDEGEVRIRAELENVRFVDTERPDERWAELSGFFDFLYVRGSPAQHFP